MTDAFIGADGGSRIRPAMPSELPRLASVYDAARGFMRKNGNLLQWAGGYPDAETLKRDIERGQLYVCEGEEGVYAAFACIPGEDPTYRIITGGAWLRDAPYCAVHRVASDGTRHGVLEQIMAFCARFGRDLRVDTHRDNRPMQGALLKNGFAYCGIIFLANGDERMAYQKILPEGAPSAAAVPAFVSGGGR